MEKAAEELSGETDAPASEAPASPGAGEAARARKPRGRGGFRRKVCAFCVDKVKHIDYKDVGRLRRFISDRGRIEPRRKTGTCAKHQRRLGTALKRARHLALLAYTPEHVRLSGMLSRS